MHKYFTRTLFATAMVALTWNNGIDIWRKLQPQLTQTSSAVPVVVPEPQADLLELVNPVRPVVPAPEVKQIAQAVSVGAPMQLAAAAVEPSRSIARTPAEVERLLAKIAAEDPRPSKRSCTNGKCGGG